MIRKLRELFLIYKHAYLKSKIDSLNYSTSISTSCAIPVLRKKTKIWMVECICFDTFQLEYHWFENEEYLNNFVSILDSLNCLYEIKEYEIQVR